MNELFRKWRRGGGRWEGGGAREELLSALGLYRMMGDRSMERSGRGQMEQKSPSRDVSQAVQGLALTVGEKWSRKCSLNLGLKKS